MHKTFEVEDRLSYRVLRWVLGVALISGIVISAIQVALDAGRVSRALDEQALQTIALVRDAATQSVFSIDNELAQQVVDGLFDVLHLEQEIKGVVDAVLNDPGNDGDGTEA